MPSSQASNDAPTRTVHTVAHRRGGRRQTVKQPSVPVALLHAVAIVGPSCRRVDVVAWPYATSGGITFVGASGVVTVALPTAAEVRQRRRAAAAAVALRRARLAALVARRDSLPAASVSVAERAAAARVRVVASVAADARTVAERRRDARRRNRERAAAAALVARHGLPFHVAMQLAMRGAHEATPLQVAEARQLARRGHVPVTEAAWRDSNAKLQAAMERRQLERTLARAVTALEVEP